METSDLTRGTLVWCFVLIVCAAYCVGLVVDFVARRKHTHAPANIPVVAPTPAPAMVQPVAAPLKRGEWHMHILVIGFCEGVLESFYGPERYSPWNSHLMEDCSRFEHAFPCREGAHEILREFHFHAKEHPAQIVVYSVITLRWLTYTQHNLDEAYAKYFPPLEDFLKLQYPTSDFNHYFRLNPDYAVHHGSSMFVGTFMELVYRLEVKLVRKTMPLLRELFDVDIHLTSICFTIRLRYSCETVSCLAASFASLTSSTRNPFGTVTSSEFSLAVDLVVASLDLSRFFRVST